MLKYVKNKCWHNICLINIYMTKGMIELIKGIAVSDGIVVGKAFVLDEEIIVIEKKIIDDVDNELLRLKTAINKSKLQIDTIKEKASFTLEYDKLALFDAHMMFLEDPEFVGEMENKIKIESLCAEHCAKEVIKKFIDIFSSMEDEYFKERRADIEDVGNRILKNLLNIKICDLSLLNEEIILVANDLTPSQTALIDKKYIKGFITDVGSRTSHTAIIARSLEIASIVGTKNASKKIKDGEILILDATKGEILINPDDDTKLKYQNLINEYLKKNESLKGLIKEKAVTLDGHEVEIAANIGSPGDIDSVINYNAQAIGLYRTEFLYMGKTSFPTEEEQFEAYKEVVVKMENKPVIIRTLDIGGDKELEYFKLPKELNPFLGYRAIRVCLEEKELFVTQLCAILRASAYGKVKIMFPMISTVEEVKKSKELLEVAKNILDEKGQKYDANIEIGIMVEIPAVAVCADMFINYVDFFSIGTNDLCQYTLAVDRMNEKISNLYNPMNISMLRLINNVIKASKDKGKITGMCGEMASHPLAIIVLLGMGLHEFSMSASSTLYAKSIIRSIRYQDAKIIANEVLKFDTHEEITSYLNNKINELEIEI